MRAAEVGELLKHLTPAERADLDKLLAADKAVWRPQPGPQADAYYSKADILGYGGAAGGGKTSLLCGLALTQHKRSMIFRREGTTLQGIYDDLASLLGTRDGFNGHDRIWRLPGRQIEFGATPDLGDERKYQGRAHDLKAFDEVPNFLESQVRFLLTWLRTTVAGQRCRAVMTMNPPTSDDGRWVIPFFGPWLDPNHPNPAEPGELRWYATIDGRDREVPYGDPFDYDGEVITPQSRTFIFSHVEDNPFLMATGYLRTLQGLPEPLRSQMLKGDFWAGVKDDIWQVIPTAWVDAAMKRWTPRDAKGPMSSIGADVARGGDDEEVISRRHGTWFDELICTPGAASPDGPTAAGRIIAHRRDRAPVHVDVIGWGSSVYDFLTTNDVQAIPINAAAGSDARSADGTLEFVNLRAELWWRMREALDPTNPDPIALPNDSGLRADLCAPRWSLKTRGVQVESKEEIRKRLGRSPDKGDAAVMALRATMPRPPKDRAQELAVPDFGAV